MTDDSVEVVWLEGGWYMEWKESKDKKLEEWRDSVCKESITLYTIELT